MALSVYSLIKMTFAIFFHSIKPAGSMHIYTATPSQSSYPQTIHLVMIFSHEIDLLSVVQTQACNTSIQMFAMLETCGDISLLICNFHLYKNVIISDVLSWIVWCSVVLWFYRTWNSWVEWCSVVLCVRWKFINCINDQTNRNVRNLCKKRISMNCFSSS